MKAFRKSSVIILLLLFALGQMVNAQCSYRDTLKVPDHSTEQILLNINGAINNDLASNGICQVNIKFKHQQIGDFIFELISPSGQMITLIGPPGVYGSTEFTTWDISFVPCNSQAYPDVGFMPKWESDQFWGNFSQYNGSYYPYNGCLEDFNTGPVDGIWTLNIIDNFQFDQGEVLKFEVVFCDPRGIDCAQCQKPEVDIQEEDIVACVGSGILGFTPQLNVVYQDENDTSGFVETFLIGRQDTFIELVDVVDMQDYPAGIYSVCGVMAPEHELMEFESYLSITAITDVIQDLNSSTPSFCAAISSDCMQVEVRNMPPVIELNENICRGDTFFFKGRRYTEEGDYTLTIPAYNNCDTTYEIHLSEIYVSSHIHPPQIITCYKPSIILDGSSSIYSSESEFKWITEGGNIVGKKNKIEAEVDKAGRYYLIVSEGDCRDTAMVTVQADLDKPHADPHNAVLNCFNPSIRLSPGIESPYDSLLWTGPGGFTSTVRRPRVDVKGKYKLILVGTNGCIDSFELNVRTDMSSPSVTAIEQDVQCEKDTVTLDIEQAVKQNFSYRWTSGTGFNAAVKDTFAQAEITTYYIEVINEDNGCIGRDSFTIDELIPLPRVSLEQEELLNCYIDSVRILNMTLPDTIGFRWTGPGDYESDAGTPWVKETGIYYMKTRTPSGCDVTDSIEIKGDFFIPDIFISGDTIRCLTDTLFLTASSSDTVDYIWTGPARYKHEGPIAPVIIPGEYMVKAITEGGCVDSMYYLVEEDFDKINLKLFSDTLTCDRTEAQVTFVSTEIDSFYWYSNTNEIIEDTSFITDTKGTNYLHFIDTSGCIGARAIVTQENIDPPEVEYDIPDFNCAHDSVQIITTTEASDFYWFDTLGYSSTEQDPWVYGAGEYYLEATGRNGCILLDTIQVAYDTIPTPINIVGQDFGCHRDTVQLSIEKPKAGMTYSWSGPGNYYSENAEPQIYDEGIYYLTVIAINGCISKDSIEIFKDTETPVLSIEGDTLNCDKPYVTLSAYANVDNVQFSWVFEGETIGDEDSVDVGQQGEYTLIGTSPNTCADTILYMLESDEDIPYFSVEMDSVTCIEHSIFPRVHIDTTDVVDFKWNGPGGFTSDMLEPELSDPGEYEFIFTMSNGCVGGSIFTLVKDDAAPPDNLQKFYLLDCADPSLILDSELDEDLYEIHWSYNGVDLKDTTSSVEINDPGLILFSAVGKNGCPLEKTIQIGIDTILPTVDIELDTFSCKVTKIPVKVHAASDSYSYTWTYPDGEISEAKEPTFTMPGHYRVEVQDTNGCSIIQTADLVADTLPPVMNVEGGSLSCSEGKFKLRFNTASPVDDIRWFGPGNFFANESEPVVQDTGYYRVTVIGPNGCFSRDTVYVDDDPPFPTFNIDAFAVNCEADSARVRIIPHSGNTYAYEWFLEDELISTSHRLVLAGGRDYLLRVTDEFNGCEVDSIIHLNENYILPDPHILLLDSLQCEKQTARLKLQEQRANKFYRLQWYSENGGKILSESSLNEVQIEGTGLYILEAVDTRNGCISYDSIWVEYNESTLKTMNLEIDEVSCAGKDNGKIEVTGIMGGVPPYKYTLNSNTYTDNNTFTDLEVNRYLISVKDKYGCRLDSLVNLDDGHILSVHLKPDTTIELGGSVLMKPAINRDTAGINTSWQPETYTNCPDCFHTTVRPTETTIFTISVSDSMGCTVKGTRKVTVNSESNAYVPSAFTPNGDGTNDVVRPFFAEDIQQVKFFAIYERRGNAVFMVENINEGEFNQLEWDGSVQGKLLPPQVFTYKLIFERKDGLHFQKSGTITLIR